MKIGYIGVGEEPRIVEIEPDENGSCLHTMQELLGGPIEPMDVLYGMEPSLYVNREGLMNEMQPNRAVYATAEMERDGYLSQFDYSSTVKAGDCYTVLFGPIIAVSYDEHGDARDITPKEWSRIERDFGGSESIASGMEACVAIKCGSDLPRRQTQAARESIGIDLDVEAGNARDASHGLSGRPCEPGREEGGRS